jgi:hypothetical protein
MTTAGTSNGSPTNAPTIDFSGSSIAHSDDGHSTALFYLYDDVNSTLIPYAGLGDPTSEINRMIAATSATDDIRLSLTPQYFSPSRTDARFRLTVGTQKGRAKEYSALTCSLAQENALEKLSKPLSWANTYSLTQMGNTQDIPAVSLFDQGQLNALQSMPLPGGSGYLQVDFTTGEAHTGFGHEIDVILKAVKQVQSFDASWPLSLISTELGSAVTALKFVGNLFSLVPGKPTVTVDISAHTGRKAFVNPRAAGVNHDDILRIPGGKALFFVIPERDQTAFEAILDDVAAKSYFVQVNKQTGKPGIFKDKAGKQPLPPINASDPNKQSALQTCSIFVLETYVEKAAS